MLAVAQTSVLPDEFQTFLGVIWLAVVVTIGIRSTAAALVAALSFVMLPALAQAYLPSWTGNLLPVFFGLGAVSAAQHPEGTLAECRTFRSRLLRWADRGATSARLHDFSLESEEEDIVRADDEDMVMARIHDHCRQGDHPFRCRAGCSHVTVRFGGLRALSKVDLEVQPASIVGLVGPNGAGKSTMLSVLSGLLRPNEGTVLLRGEDVTHASPQVRARKGMARTFQQPELFLGLTVRDHLVLAHRMRFARRRLWRDVLDPRSLLQSSTTEDERVDSLLELLNLTRVAAAPVAALPLGISRLVEVGRALATDPDLILLDEPLSGLDMKASENLQMVFRRVVERSDRTVSLLLVEHDVAAVLSLSDWIFVLDFGEQIAAACPDDIRRDPAVRSAYLGDEDPSPGAPLARSGTTQADG